MDIENSLENTNLLYEENINDQLSIIDEIKANLEPSNNEQKLAEVNEKFNENIEQLFINHLTNNQKIKINENLLNSLFQNDS